MKKVRILALVLVFAFAALGGAYAMWYDSLFLKTTVKTGSVDVCWTSVSTSDDGKNYAGQSGKPGENVYQGNTDSLDGGTAANPTSTHNKNIGSLNATKSSDTEFAGSDVRNTDDMLTITLDNGYPGYQEYVTAGITNKGTVPVKFRVIKDKVPEWMIVQVDMQTAATSTSTSTGGAVLMCLPPTPPPTPTPFSDLEGYQLDPGETITAKITYRVLQIAPQGATASFNVQLKGIQWNEYSKDESYKLKNEIVTERNG